MKGKKGEGQSSTTNQSQSPSWNKKEQITLVPKAQSEEDAVRNKTVRMYNQWDSFSVSMI